MRSRLMWLAAVAACVLEPAANAQELIQETDASVAVRLFEEWRFDEAERAMAEVQRTRPGDPDTRFLEGYERFLAGDFRAAAAKLRLAVQGGADKAAQPILTLAEGAAKATEGYAERRSKHFVVRFPPEDAVLADYGLDALEASATALHEDLGWEPARLIPVDILRSPADLALFTSLSVEDVERTGTIAVSKWGRIMLTSPRAMRLGYPWQESLSHELVHCAVSSLTREQAPVWLQEGFAKFLDRRWNAPAGLALTPSLQQMLARALASNKLITFEAMHPSMAKLPGAEAASLAFAEVTTAIATLHARGGMEALRSVMTMVRDGADARVAVARAYGGSGTWAEFDRAWKAFMAGQHWKPIPGFEAIAPRFRKRSAIASRRAPSEDEAAEGGAADRYLRLGNMLLLRNRARAASLEYEKGLKLAGPTHWLFAVKLGRTQLALGDTDGALQAVSQAEALYPELPWPHLIAGQALLAKGDAASAIRPLLASLANNPFDPNVHCSMAEAYQKAPAQDAPAPRRQRAERDCKALSH